MALASQSAKLSTKNRLSRSASSDYNGDGSSSSGSFCSNSLAPFPSCQLSLATSPVMNPENALELLGPRFSNPLVRRYAVFRLRQARDEELELYLLQLVQVVEM